MSCLSCNDGLSSSRCVEFDENYSVYDLLIKVQEQLNGFDAKFNKSVDGKTLASGTDLVNTVQKLVDVSISKTNVKESLTINVDLQCLMDSCSTIINQAQLNNLLIKEMCFLKSELNNLKSII